jgi:spermidine/putrescine transport system substrate-binding protein
MKDDDVHASRSLNNRRSSRISRRRALRTLGSGVAAAVAAPWIVRHALADQLVGPGGIPLARPNQPVTLPRFEDPIKSGLEAEKGGTFTIFNYADYIDKKVVTEFGKKYGVKTQITTFDSIDQAITRLAKKAVRADVTEITPERVAQAVAGKLLKPLNLDYIPNLKANIWPQLHSPFYDVESRYTVPYTLYSTGIGWRNDKVSEDIAKLDNPWSIFWNSQKYKGYVGVLDDDREALGMAMLYRGDYDINSEDPAKIGKALADLKALIPICNPKINITEYQTLAEGSSWLHESWSGDMFGAVISYLPKGTDASVLSYWTPPRGKQIVQNDCFCVTAQTKKPVLAHLFLNYLLDNDVSYGNFVNFVGYQPPLNSITPEKLMSDNVIPKNLSNIVMTPEDLGPDSLQIMSLTPKGQALWQNAYAKFVSGV